MVGGDDDDDVSCHLAAAATAVAALHAPLTLASLSPCLDTSLNDEAKVRAVACCAASFQVATYCRGK